MELNLLASGACLLTRHGIVPVKQKDLLLTYLITFYGKKVVSSRYCVINTAFA